jgi:alkanesulfonate monooxygenase SsuD/methylene tetrahydromethanopterin reductase-like flavin-dependent oxidoreductase (luciferase family)
MGLERRERVPRFEQSLSMVRRLLAGEEVSAAGPWPVERARVGPVPDQRVDVWVGGAAPAALDRAARLGDAWVAGPYAPTGELAGQVERYREACETHGTHPEVMAVRRDVHVGADDDDAHRVADPVIAAGYRGLDPKVLIVGGPDRVAEEFRGLAALGFTDVIIRQLADEQADVLASFERLAGVRLAVARQ